MATSKSLLNQTSSHSHILLYSNVCITCSCFFAHLMLFLLEMTLSTKHYSNSGAGPSPPGLIIGIAFYLFND